jgi:hypothetical protein
MLSYCHVCRNNTHAAGHSLAGAEIEGKERSEVAL